MASLPPLKISKQKNLVINGGTYSSIYIINSTNITLNNVTVKSPPLESSNSQAVRVVGSTNIEILNATITGQNAINGVPIDALRPDKTNNIIGLPAGKAVGVDFTKSFVIRNSRISGFHNGIAFNSSSVIVDGCDIFNIRTTAIRGVPLDGSKFTRNRTWDIKPWRFGADLSDGGSDGDHGAAIHLWTLDTPIKDIVIADNIFQVMQMLGIELDDNRKGLGFSNTRILRNHILGNHGSGIWIENTYDSMLDANWLEWTGVGKEWNHAPRVIPMANSRNLTISRTRSINFTREVIDLTSKSLLDKGSIIIIKE